MTLELNKLTTQMDAMGRTIAEQRSQARDKSSIARELLRENPEVTEELERKIAVARSLDAWRRGAVPKNKRLDDYTAPRVSMSNITLIAADGSQIYPDRHAAATYYLLNTGTIIFRHGTGEAPAVNSTPKVCYANQELYDDDGEVRSADFVNAQRNRCEIKALADLAEAERAALGGDISVPIVCILDGPLLPWMRPDPENRNAINKEIEFFARQFERMKKAQAIPVGYVDKPGSANVLRILELINIPIEEITREKLRQGVFRQLSDRMMFSHLLPPGYRSAIFEPTSKTNDLYHNIADQDRIGFFYANMAKQSGAENAIIARLEVPGWIAGDPAKLDIAQAALYANCEPVCFPYVLARAHELAVVTNKEKAYLDQMLEQAMMKNRIRFDVSAKATDKSWTSHRR